MGPNNTPHLFFLVALRVVSQIVCSSFTIDDDKNNKDNKVDGVRVYLLFGILFY